ncbi:MAG: GNAT family N-acetyltransferase [Oscillospiraceae bacterium]|nr:GNAT family N-acetyltransferase [Oscillospiraceae bacterium]
MQYTIEDRVPTAEQWMSLRKSVGWATFPLEAAARSLAVTPYCVCAFADERLIGMGRVLGDGCITFYVGNIMVCPDRQGEGVGSRIMERIMTYLDTNAVPGAIASLLSIKGKEAFYSQFGFACRPDDHHGSGMSKRF